MPHLSHNGSHNRRNPGTRATTRLIVAFVLCLQILSAEAGTIVRVSTSLGDFSIELLDETAPVTVQNFLNYVNRNDYNGTYFHRVVDDFVVQGGAFRFELFVGPIDIPTDPPIVNEFNASNVRGTVAMAKLDGDPDSATNQWFVNLVDNSDNLDNNNGGFTVFGNVLGDGMITVDAIDALPIINLGAKASNAPYFTPQYNNPLDFVYMNVEITERFSSAPHLFESASGLLISSVDVDNGDSVISLNFNTVPAESGVVIQANLESVIPRQAFEGIATYSTADNRLRIPTLEANIDGQVSLVNNVVFVLSDPVSAQFTLESFDQ